MTALEAAIDQLPDALRTVFMLRAVERLPFDAIAAALMLAPDEVRNRQRRAEEFLRLALAQEIDAAMNHVYGFAGIRCERIVADVLMRVPPGSEEPAH